MSKIKKKENINAEKEVKVLSINYLENKKLIEKILNRTRNKI